MCPGDRELMHIVLVIENDETVSSFRGKIENSGLKFTEKEYGSGARKIVINTRF